MTRFTRLIAWLERRNARSHARSQHNLSHMGSNAVTTKKGTQP